MNKAVVLLMLTTAGSVLACAHLAVTLREERAQRAELEARVAELKELADRVNALNQVRPPLGVTPVSPGRSPRTETVANETAPASFTHDADDASDATARLDPRERARERLERQRELLQDPEYREALRKQHRLQLATMYPGLENALGLTAEETERLLDLLAAQRVQDMTEFVDGPRFFRNRPDAMRELEATLRERQLRHLEQIEAELGSSVRQKWAEYQETIGQRHRAASLQSQLTAAGSPLDAQQSQALLDALLAEQRHQTNDLSGGGWNTAFASSATLNASIDPSDWLRAQEESHQRILAALAPKLNGEQLGQIAKIFARERETQRASLELMQVQGFEAGAPIIGGPRFGPLPAAGPAIEAARMQRPPR